MYLGHTQINKLDMERIHVMYRFGIPWFMFYSVPPRQCTYVDLGQIKATIFI